jgi:hypothetical protein
MDYEIYDLGELLPNCSYDCTSGKLWQLMFTDLKTYFCLSRLLRHDMMRMLAYTTSEKQQPVKM